MATGGLAILSLAMPSAPRPAPMPIRPMLRHRGFELAVLDGGRGGASQFGFAISHRGLQLHASTPEFRSAVSADRAARRFVDDALGVFAFGEAPASA